MSIVNCYCHNLESFKSLRLNIKLIPTIINSVRVMQFTWLSTLDTMCKINLLTAGILVQLLTRLRFRICALQ